MNAIDLQALHERMQQVERSIPASIAPMMVMAPVVAWLNREVLPPLWLAGWLAAVMLVLAGRFMLARRLVADPPPVAQARGMLRRMVWRAVPGGVLLALTVLLFFRPGDAITLTVLAVLTLLAFAGQVATAAPPLPVIATLLGPGIVTLVSLSLWTGGTLGRFVALLLLLFSWAIARIARNLGHTLDREIRARLHNQQLAADLALANQAKSRFLAAASHDIRQPVHALALFLNAFDDAALAGRNAQLIGPLRESARGLLEMLDGVLDLSRAEAGAVLPRSEPVAVQVLLDLLEREFAPLAEARGLVLRTVPSSARLHADPALTERILRNLVSNSLRYTQRGGVLVGLRRRGSLAWLEVWDTGVGIAPAEQEGLFAEFTRGADAARAESSGLGLGLAIARRFAQAQGAPLTLASRVGRGTVFRLGLPLA